MAGTRAQSITSLKEWDMGKRLRALIPGSSGMDEVEAGEHLTNGATVDSAEWSATKDLKTGGGNMSLTVTNEQDKDLAAFFGGELTEALQILIPEANRIMTEGSANWTNGNLATFSLSGNHIRAYGDAADEYFTLAAEYAPMVADEEYEMTLYATGGTWVGSWDFQDVGGRPLILTEDSPTHPGGWTTDDPFWCEANPTNAVYKFKAPAGTSGGFKIKAHGGVAEVQFFDDFKLVNTNAKVIAKGMVFRVTSTGDTTDNALALAKGSAPANNDLFAITSKTTVGGELMPTTADRDFSIASNWVDVDLDTGSGTYNEDGDLTLLAGAAGAGDYCELPDTSAPMTAGTAYRIKCDVSDLAETWEIQDITGAQVFGTISANGDGKTFDFQLDGGLTGGFRIVAGANDAAVTLDNFSLKAGLGTVKYVGNDVGSYALGETATQTSTLIQTASDRTSAGSNAKGKALKEYRLTYTVAVKEAIAPAGALALTVETFVGESTEMPITVGAQVVYFLASSDAAAADFVIQAVGSSVTAGVLALSAFTLGRVCDAGVNPHAGEWIMVRPLEADVTFSAVSTLGDDLTSVTLAVLESNSELRGRWTRIIPTSGKLLAYRL